jgi:hypothetical protein
MDDHENQVFPSVLSVTRLKEEEKNDANPVSTLQTSPLAARAPRAERGSPSVRLLVAGGHSTPTTNQIHDVPEAEVAVTSSTNSPTKYCSISKQSDSPSRDTRKILFDDAKAEGSEEGLTIQIMLNQLYDGALQNSRSPQNEVKTFVYPHLEKIGFVFAGKHKKFYHSEDRFEAFRLDDEMQLWLFRNGIPNKDKLDTEGLQWVTLFVRYYFKKHIILHRREQSKELDQKVEMNAKSLLNGIIGEENTRHWNENREWRTVRQAIWYEGLRPAIERLKQNKDEHVKRSRRVAGGINLSREHSDDIEIWADCGDFDLPEYNPDPSCSVELVRLPDVDVQILDNCKTTRKSLKH